MSDAELSQKIEAFKNDSLCVTDFMMTKSYLPYLQYANRCASNQKNIEPKDYKLIQVKKIVFDDQENIHKRLVSVLTGLQNSTIVFVLNSDGANNSLYLGVKGDITEQNYFESSLMGNLEGLQFEALDASPATDVLNNIGSTNINSIVSLSMAPSIRKTETESISTFVQGLEHLTEACGNKKYSLVIIAKKISNDEIMLMKSGYENIYSEYSSKAHMTLTENMNRSETEGKTETYSFSSGISKTIGSSISHSLGQTTSKNHDWGRFAGALLGAAGGAALGILLPGVNGIISAATKNGVTNLAQGGTSVLSYLSPLSFLGGTLGSAAIGTNNNTQAPDVETKQTNETKNENKQRSYGTQHSITLSKGSSMQTNFENKKVTRLLDKIDNYLERLDEATNYGCFNFATYVTSDSVETAQQVASVYSGIVKGDSSDLEPVAINVWKKDNKAPHTFNNVLNSIKNFEHPLFTDNNQNGGDIEQYLTPQVLVTTNELAIGLALPKVSIPGIVVKKEVAFGQNFELNESGKNISIGKMYHLGETKDNRDIIIDIEKLSSHMFVTGSTGSGKSTFIYNLIRRIKQKYKDIKIMVIEPAKGEYGPIFKNEGFKHYIADKKMDDNANQLNINPFKHPEHVSKEKQIEFLMGVFNSAWRNYANMSSFLKKGLIKCYEAETAMQPVEFSKLKDAVTNSIKESNYSMELKNNYIAELGEHIDDLSSGMYKNIFTQYDKFDEILESDSVIDLSQLNSDGIAVVMGIIINRLRNYCIEEKSKGKIENNNKLRHIVILEEAHNIMPALTSNFGDSNTISRSVEMIANSIAEMRTYGEGFIIVDQSPLKVNSAAIKNSNTKVVLRLNDIEDCKTIGHSIGLNEEQIYSLPWLDKGVFVVNQMGNRENVLGKLIFAGDKNDAN